MSEPSPSPPFSTGCADGVVAAYGDVDVVTCELFASAVNALVAEAVCRERRGGVRLDLAGVGFVGVAGARVLVEAAAVLPPGLELVVHPPAMLARIVEVGWGQVAGSRFELFRADEGVKATMER